MNAMREGDRRILVVEDDEGLQQLIRQTAERAGFEVLQAFDGAAGLALALTRSPHLILLDINMPTLDGRDVLSHLKRDPRTANVPVLVCSGRTDSHNRHLALELGAIDFVDKPFHPKELMLKIGRAIDKQREATTVPSPPQPDLAPSPVSNVAAVGRKLAGGRAASSAQDAAATGRELRVLLAEDTDDDAFMFERELRQHGYAPSILRLQSREAMTAALRDHSFDLVVSDFSMPGFDALDALATLKDSGLDLPFIVVSGTVDEASAVIALKAGAHDFVVKGNFARLVPAVEREVREARLRHERRSMEEQLMVSDRMASVGMLAASVAHEINNPLAAVLGNLSIVREYLDRETATPSAEAREAAEAAADAVTAAERVREIVRDVKMFSRGSEERSVAVDVHRVLESTLRMAWNDIRHRARVVRNLGPVNAVMGSEQRLGQVFLNLVVNAAQAIAPGSSTENEIRVSTWMEGDRVVVEVTDTGEGIPAAVLPRLFTAFVTTKAPGQGTGLGLSIVRRIVTALGGEVGVESEPGRGSTFRVSLPGVDQPAFSLERSPQSPAGEVSRARLLIVDDEVIVTNTIRRIAGGLHDLTVVFSAAEALARLHAGERFDLIVCDLLMPEMTGIELHAALLAEVPDQAARMLFMTGGTFTAEAAAFLDAHTESVLDKPFDKPTFLTAISARLRRGPLTLTAAPQ
jgi:CheY-like chemotaxis protein